MKFKKSKPLSQTEPELKKNEKSTFFGKRKSRMPLSPKEIMLLQEEKLRIRSERLKKLKQGIGKFFTIFFILAVIFSMIAVPLIIVFG